MEFSWLTVCNVAENLVRTRYGYMLYCPALDQHCLITAVLTNQLPSVVGCSRGCKPSRTLLLVSSLGPEDLNMRHRYCISCIGNQYGSVFCSRWLCWCTRVGTVWLRLTCRHTASQRHYTTVGVTFGLPYLENSLFHARRRTTVTAAAQLCC